MSIFIWNVRGMNKKGRRKDVIDHIQKLTPSIVALAEAKVELNEVYRVFNCVPQFWLSCNNFHLSEKGRIWVSRNPQVWFCSVLACSLQQFTLSVKNKEGLEGFP